jgi:hypothetical protein
MSFTLIDDEVQPENSSLGSDILRHAGRTGLRVAEQVAGAPGDILSLINEFIARPVTEGITREESLPYEKLPVSKLLPTSEQFRKGNISGLGEKAAPTNKVEGFFDNLISDATSLFLPGRKTTILKSAFSALFKSTGANLAKEATKNLTADEKKGSYAHLGALALLSFIDKPSAAQAISKGYKPLEATVAKLSPVNAAKLENTLNNLKTKMQKGTVAPSEKFIIDEVDAVLSKIKNGKITPEEAWASKRSLNEKLTDVLFKIPKITDQKRARKLSSIISHELDDSLALTKSQDPKFYKELKGWNNAYKTLADSNIISKWVESNLRYTPMTAGLLHLMGGPLGTKTAGLAIPYAATKVLYRIGKSPKLAEHYMKTLSMAAAENAQSFNRQLKILDKELQKEEEKDKFTLVD